MQTLYTASEAGAAARPKTSAPAENTSRSTPGFEVAAAYEGNAPILSGPPLAEPCCTGNPALLSALIPAVWFDFSRRASSLVLACKSAFCGTDPVSTAFCVGEKSGHDSGARHGCWLAGMRGRIPRKTPSVWGQQLTLAGEDELQQLAAWRRVRFLLEQHMVVVVVVVGLNLVVAATTGWAKVCRR